MPLPLPGFVDCSHRATIAMQGSASLRLFITPFSTPVNNVASFQSAWVLEGQGDAFKNLLCAPGFQSDANRTIRLSGPFAGSPVTLESYIWTCHSETVGIPTWSDAYTFTETAGPYRLGMRWRLIGAAAWPQFAGHYTTEYTWFADQDTFRIQSMAGKSRTQYIQPDGSWGATRNLGMTPVNVGARVGRLDWGATATIGGGANEQVRFTSLSGNGGLIDLTGADYGQPADTVLIGGAGAMTIKGRISAVTAPAFWAMPPYEWAYDVKTTRFGGANLATRIVDRYVVPVQLHDDGSQRSPQADYLTSPVASSYSAPNVSWQTRVKTSSGELDFEVQSAWAAAQDPVFPSDDRGLLINTNPPRLTSDYLPVTVTLAAAVDVSRPDGLQPSSWVGAGQVTVTENSADTLFETTAAGASATRTLVSDWKHRVGLHGTGDPLFGFAECERTKHRAGEDIWGWSTYAYLRVQLTSSKECTLLLTVRGNHLTISDTHETSGAARAAAFTATATPWVKTYPIVLREGANTVDLDLLFPNEAPRPFYVDRVDELVLSGFPQGTFRLTALKLVAKGPGYLKWAPGKQIQRDDYSAWGLAVDGAFVYGNLPDQVLKPDEIGTTGGNPRYIDPLIGTGTGTILDTQYSLTSFCAVLNSQEGLSVTYTDAVRLAAMQDPYGTALVSAATELAQFMKWIAPYTGLTPGTPYQPDCAVMSRRIQITNCIGYSVRVNHPFWGALEALAVTPQGERVGEGALVNAVRTDSGATVAQGLTDRYGYVVCTPIPANGVRLYGLQAAEDPQPIEGSVALRPRDLPRLPVKVNIAETGPWPLEVRTGQYHRTHARSGRVYYRRANHVLPPFAVGSSPSEGLQPRCTRDHRGRVRLFYTEEPLPVGGVVQRVSDDDGATFGGASVVLPGGAFPSVTYDPRTQTVFAVMYGGGTLYGWRERPTSIVAGPLLTDTGAAFQVEEDVAHACPAPGGPGRWLLTVRVLGEGAISLWESTDDGLTWVRRATGLTGYKHPHVLADHGLGMVLVAGYSESTLAGTLRYPGETSFRAAHLFRGTTGAPLDVADVTFGVAVAHEGPGRWVLATRIRGEPQISEFFSADFGRTWTRVSQ